MARSNLLSGLWITFIVAFFAFTCCVSSEHVQNRGTRAARHNDRARVLRVRSPDNGTEIRRGASSTDWKKRDGNAQFTYYSPGEGACGGWNTASDYIVALNSEEYGNGEHCYEMITISYNGASASAQIVDECMGCGYNNLDLSPGLFSDLAPLYLGEITGAWYYGGEQQQQQQQQAAPPPPKSTTHSKSTTWTPPPSTTHHSTTKVTSTSTSAAATQSSPSFTDPTSNFLAAMNDAMVDIAALIATGAQQGALTVADAD